MELNSHLQGSKQRLGHGSRLQDPRTGNPVDAFTSAPVNPAPLQPPGFHQHSAPIPPHPSRNSVHPSTFSNYPQSAPKAGSACSVESCEKSLSDGIALSAQDLDQAEAALHASFNRVWGMTVANLERKGIVGRPVAQQQPGQNRRRTGSRAYQVHQRQASEPRTPLTTAEPSSAASRGARSNENNPRPVRFIHGDTRYPKHSRHTSYDRAASVSHPEMKSYLLAFTAAPPPTQSTVASQTLSEWSTQQSQPPSEPRTGL